MRRDFGSNGRSVRPIREDFGSNGSLEWGPVVGVGSTALSTEG